MIGEPRNYKPLHPDDVGTRLEHMMELQNTWNTVYGMLTRPGYHTALEKERAGQLEIALSLLQHHMEAEYNPTSVAKVINNLPKNPTEITDEDDRDSPPTGTLV